MINKALTSVKSPPERAGSFRKESLGHPGDAPVVVILGATNVGKSSLFNRLLRRRRSIVSALPGTTRDLLMGDWEGPGGRVRFVDTPSMQGGATQGMIEAGDLLLLLTDATLGCTTADEIWAGRLRRSDHSTLLVVNKTDSRAGSASVGEFYRLALGEPIPVSAAHGTGIAELREKIRARLGPGVEGGIAQPRVTTVAIVGRPNVGKSSLSNRLLGHPRSAVEENPGTTRDSVEGWRFSGQRWYQILDTAGKGRRCRDPLLRLAGKKVERSLGDCDVAVLVLDVTESVRGVDRSFLRKIHDQGKPVLVVGNKIDIFRGKHRSFLQECRTAFGFVGKPPILLLSARTGKGCQRLLPAASLLVKTSGRQISTRQLHEFLHQLHRKTGANRFVARHAIQVGVRPPHFLFFHSSSRVPRGVRTFLENRVRSHFHLESVPVRLDLRRSGRGR